MTQTNAHRSAARGAALVTALALLALFSALGAAWLASAYVEINRAEVADRQARARRLAVSGLYRAIAETGRALRAGEALPARDESAFELPVYRAEPGETPAVSQRFRGQAAVTRMDENSKINLNHAPPVVVARLLEVDQARAAARTIRENLGRTRGPEPRWLTSVESLGQRSWEGQEAELIRQAVAGLDENLVTVFTAADPANPRGYFNVNAARPGALAAAFGLSEEQAERIASGGPYDSLDAAWAAAEIEPGAVNEGLSEAARRSVRESVRFSSDCYRFICVATLYDEQRGGRGVRTRAYEAVVLYDEEGRPQIRYWNETQTPQPAQTGDV